MKFTETNDKSSDVIKPEFYASFNCHLILFHSVLATSWTDWGEEQMSAIGKPIHPAQLRVVRNPSQRQLAEMQYSLAVIGEILGEVEFCPFNLALTR